ncbi:helix-turn-helix transcriptional regulator [Mucilaginibacter robiniae]|uniref:Helix-turn-helix transcriptional regulator n=1 Tax=Mucilaginibacter robiniae TaxID=2728022 RepID=A0A7L5E103_9SPHI|nr:helix-turn-helix transcriptional regulator [Mucilaginibacter robiniae]QJD95969.1 helix-turn-helix transcriptional regulator [Mucilaginibacter robiniae]
MNTTGNRIRIQRLMKNYSQEYMAFELGISQAAYSKIERDETELSIRRIYAIAEILEISPFVLLPRPKYGTGINHHALLQFGYRFRQWWHRVFSSTPAASADPESAHSDTSNAAA